MSNPEIGSQKAPSITVLMPVYNGENYLEKAVESLLDQSFGDFELLAIDDASTDRSREILSSYNDSRLRLVCNEHNLGQTPTLNRGLELAQGVFIARADQDDIYLPARLEKQAAFLQAHPDFSAVGSQVMIINREGKVTRKMALPSDEAVIRIRMITENPMVHSAMMFSTETVRKLGGYDQGYRFIEDWDLWSRMLIAGFKISNLQDILVKYRKYEESSSGRLFSKTRHDEIPRMIQRNLEQLAMLELDEQQAEVFYHARYSPDGLDRERLEQAMNITGRVTDKLEEIAKTRLARKELKRLESLLNLHLASAARKTGERALARSIYGKMILRGQYPLKALARYGAAFLSNL